MYRQKLAMRGKLNVVWAHLVKQIKFYWRQKL